MYEFKLPDLGEGIHEGEIIKWHVKAGDTIKADDPLVDVETDKAAVTIPSPKGGKIESVSGEVGKTVKVGKVIAVIDEGDGAAESAKKPESKSERRPTKEAAAEKEAEEEEPAEPGKKPEAKAERRPAKEAPAEKEEEEEKAPSKREKAAAEEKAAPRKEKAPPTEKKRAPAEPSEEDEEEEKPEREAKRAPAREEEGERVVVAAPATRRLARELGVDIRRVPPSGPGGRVTPEDVEAYAQRGEKAEEPEEEAAERPKRAEAGAPSGIPFLDLEPLPDFEQYGPVEKIPLRSIRRKVARKMTTSMILVPHVAHMDEADVTDLEAFRRRERARREDQPGGKLTLLPFVMKAVCVGLMESPQLNASLDPFNEEIIHKKFYNIGFAADTSKGLIVPVVRNVEKKSVLQLSADIIDLATKARDEKLEVSNLRGGTFTITNFGAIGGVAGIPTINYPEVAILGMGRAQERAVVRDGQIVIRTILPITLTYDHRVVDGADAARFTNKLVERLSDPHLLLLEM